MHYQKYARQRFSQGLEISNLRIIDHQLAVWAMAMHQHQATLPTHPTFVGCFFVILLLGCHDPSHGGFYMAEGAPYIRIRLPPRVVSGDRLVPSCCGLTVCYLHCRRAYPMSHDWGCTSTYLPSPYVPILVYAALRAIPLITCTSTSMVVCIP